MEESEDANPVRKHPSLPENYVTLAMLKERWLQRKKEEDEEELLKQQRNLKPEPNEENANPVTKHSSLPENYVTLAMLKERWLQRKKEEEEEELLKQQPNLKPEPNEENVNGSKIRTEPTEPVTGNGNRQKFRRRGSPRHPRQPQKDRRGCLKEYEEPKSIDSVVIPRNLDIKAEKTKVGKTRAPGNVKLQANASTRIIAGEEKSGNEEGNELQLTENGVKKASGRSFHRKKKRRNYFKRNEGPMKALQQAEEGLGENEKKDSEGLVGLNKASEPLAMKIVDSFQDLSLNDPKSANVIKRTTKVKDHQGSTRYEKTVEEEKRVKDGRKDRMRIGSGGGRWRKMGNRRASSTMAGNQLVWVKKGETPGSCVTTDFNSQVHP